jgi:hypothetical protein
MGARLELRGHDFGGPIVVWGSTRETTPIIEAAKREKRCWIYIDHKYLGPRWDRYRFTVNDYQHNGHGKSDGERFGRLGLTVKPWRKRGGFVLVCPPGDLMSDLRRWQRPAAWTESVLAELSQHTDRRIIVREKPRIVDQGGEAFRAALRGCWCVVTHISNTSLDAMVEGIPSIVTGDCAAAAICDTDLSKIEAPNLGDREQLFAVLADNQWTRKEIQSGKCWADLREMST